MPVCKNGSGYFHLEKGRYRKGHAKL